MTCPQSQWRTNTPLPFPWTVCLLEQKERTFAGREHSDRFIFSSCSIQEALKPKHCYFTVQKDHSEISQTSSMYIERTTLSIHRVESGGGQNR